MTDQVVVGGQLGNYLIDSVIGRGGMSVVYRAKHSRLGMAVALKVLAPELSADDTFRERFLREAQMAAAVDHPNVIPIHDMGVHDSSLYIVMRYVAGGDLKTLLAKAGPLDPVQAIALLMPAALALDAAHTHGLIHRDVKPANILLQRSGGGDVDHVYLTDFGIAKSASSTTRLTSTGAFIGTIEYMAPEQMDGRDISARTDVYALGATFYECVTGRVPYQRELSEGVRFPSGPPESVAARHPGLPRALDGPIARALAQDPADRYVTCEQFLLACRNALDRQTPGDDQAGEAIAATQLSSDEPPASPTADATDREREPVVAQVADAGAAGEGPPPVAAGGGSHEPDGLLRRLRDRRLYGAIAIALIAGAVAALLAGSKSSTPPGRLASSPLAAVPTNHVTGSGHVTLRLDGDSASVTVTTVGLDGNAPLVHAMHIHAGGKGECPPASAARLHGGHLAIDTNDGQNYYGPPVQALTVRGDTSVASILAFPRYLTGGTLHYSRTIELPANVVNYIRENNAVIVVHGIDYDNSGIYSGVLERSDLDKSLPATATAPALCGRLVGPQEVAASGSRPRTRVYTAFLAQPVSSDGTPALFECHAPEPVDDAEPRRATRADVHAVASDIA